jgi:hypothetical protein
MPIALFAALAGSLAIHLAGLFGTDLELFGDGPEPQPLQAEIRPLPVVPVLAETPLVSQSPASKPATTKPAKTMKAPKGARAKAAPVTPPALPAPESVPESSSGSSLESPPEITSELPSTAAISPPPQLQQQPPPKAILPAIGVIRFAIFKESLGLQVGRAEHRWAFLEDGSYRLTGITETSGLAALLKPLRLQVESSGRLVVGGLQPETLRTLKNGKATNENADFSWLTAEVTLSRDGSVRPIAPGTQDILSLNYQLAYLGQLADGASIGVVTGKKYERYALDSLGEEEIDTPAGHFRTLHLRAMTDSVTEIWIALDRGRLPVKIRFTDKKGESFEQVATEIGMP